MLRHIVIEIVVFYIASYIVNFRYDVFAVTVYSDSIIYWDVEILGNIHEGIIERLI